MVEGRLTAAGGVLWRRGNGAIEVLMVHRPRYQDWSLPKGKPEPAENALQTAAREVTEETGLPFRIGVRLGRVDYLVGSTGKSVSYWAMRLDPSSDGDPASIDPEEIDDYRWVSVSDALRLLSYPTDRHVMERFNRIGTTDVSLILLRHAHAGNRDDWSGPDVKRPLTARGCRQSTAVSLTVPAFAPQSILSAPLERCRSTVEPLARQLGQSTRLLPAFADDRFEQDPDEVVGLAARLATTPGPVLVCSQGITIRGVLQRLHPPYPTNQFRCRKGGMWVLGTANRRIVTADYYPRLVPDHEHGSPRLSPSGGQRA